MTLQELARRLRRLSQEEPLLQPRPGYPRAGLGRSHADEVRETLDGVASSLEEIKRRLPEVLPAGARPLGVSADEDPRVVAERLETLIRLVAGLKKEAFQPPPPLPPVTPPYLVEPPGHDLAGTKAVVLAAGIEQIVSTIQTLILALLNGQPPAP